VGGFTSCCSLRRGPWRADDLPWAPADNELERPARVADGQVSVGAWADHHHDAG
jgi:hypothetical protein